MTSLAAARGETQGPKHAMVLAAGLGTRMRPLTDHCPKPLIEVKGRTLLDRMIDRLEEAGVEHVVINTHYLGEMVEAHAHQRAYPRITCISEPDLLETGGGVKQALPLLGEAPFFVVNSDALLLNGPYDSLRAMHVAWNPDIMDALLMLHATVDAFGYDGRGDFCAEADGQLLRRPELEVAPWLFTGVQILKPSLFKDTPEGAFSLNVLYDRAIEAGRLYGTWHDGEWFDVGTPQGLKQAETFMHLRYAGRERR